MCVPHPSQAQAITPSSQPAQFSPAPAPPASPFAGKFSLPKVEEKETNDPDIERVLDQVRTRQWAAKEKLDHLTPGDMAFGLMRNIPRKDWNTPLTEMGHWPRGSSIAEIKANPKLKNFTPAEAIQKLFEMDDAMKGSKPKHDLPRPNADAGAKLQHHEQSETVDTEDGKFINVYGRNVKGKAGQPLPKRYDFEKEKYDTVKEAVEAAKRRSQEEGKRGIR